MDQPSRRRRQLRPPPPPVPDPPRAYRKKQFSSIEYVPAIHVGQYILLFVISLVLVVIVTLFMFNIFDIGNREIKISGNLKNEAIALIWTSTIISVILTLFILTKNTFKDIMFAIGFINSIIIIVTLIVSLNIVNNEDVDTVGKVVGLTSPLWVMTFFVYVNQVIDDN